MKTLDERTYVFNSYAGICSSFKRDENVLIACSWAATMQLKHKVIKIWCQEVDIL